MADSGADAREIEETAAPAPVLPDNGGLDRRARMADSLEGVEELQRRIRAKRGDNPPVNAADTLNKLREERIEQISSAAQGVYERETKRESEGDMADSGADTRVIEETATSAPVFPDGEISAEKVGDGWRASPNGSADDDGREFLQKVKDAHRAEKEQRERERRESGSPNAYFAADMISEMRNERDEQILSAVLGIYDEEEED